MALILRWKDLTTLPAEAAGLNSVALLGLSLADVGRLPLPVGNGTAELGDLFHVETDDSPSDRLVLEGDLRPIRNLGQGLPGGQLVVRGRAGDGLGQAMRGGEITVHGDVGDWAGSEMSGGILRIHGNAGDHLGAARPGSRLGMREGVILVDGTAGCEVGRRMRRGLIALGLGAGTGVGRWMIAGTILVFGAVGPCAGMGMKRGTIGLLGGENPSLLPSFVASGTYRLPFLSLYQKQLITWGFRGPGLVSPPWCRRYNGDLAARGQGEILVAVDAAGD